MMELGFENRPSLGWGLGVEYSGWGGGDVRASGSKRGQRVIVNVVEKGLGIPSGVDMVEERAGGLVEIRWIRTEVMKTNDLWQ